MLSKGKLTFFAFSMFQASIFLSLLGYRMTGSQNMVKRLRQNNLHFAPWKLLFQPLPQRHPQRIIKKGHPGLGVAPQTLRSYHLS